MTRREKAEARAWAQISKADLAAYCPSCMGPCEALAQLRREALALKREQDRKV